MIDPQCLGGSQSKPWCRWPDISNDVSHLNIRLTAERERADENHALYERAKAQLSDYNSALGAILKGFDEGVWVRSTKGDGDPQWALNLLPHLKALADAQKILCDSST